MHRIPSELSCLIISFLIVFWLLLRAEVKLALASDLLGSLLVVTPHSLLFLKLLEHQGLLVAVDDLI